MSFDVGMLVDQKPDDPPPIDLKLKIIFRDHLQSLFLRFVSEYSQNVISDVTTQEAFIRKFDNLAT